MSDIRYTPPAAISGNTPLANSAASASGIKATDGHTREVAIGIGQKPKAKNSISEFFSKVTLPVRNLFSRLANWVSAQFKEPELTQDNLLKIIIKDLGANPNQAAIDRGMKRLQKLQLQGIALKTQLAAQNRELKLKINIQTQFRDSVRVNKQPTKANDTVIAQFQKDLAGLEALQRIADAKADEALYDDLYPENAKTTDTDTSLDDLFSDELDNEDFDHSVDEALDALSESVNTPPLVPQRDDTLAPAAQRKGPPPALPPREDIATKQSTTSSSNKGRPLPPIPVAASNDPLAAALASSTPKGLEALENPFSEFPEADVLDDTPPPIPPRDDTPTPEESAKRLGPPPPIPPREAAQDTIDLANMTDEERQAYVNSLPPPPPPPPSDQVPQRLPTPPPFPATPPPSNRAEPQPTISTPSRSGLLEEIASKGASDLKPKEDQKPLADKPVTKETSNIDERNAAITSRRKFIENDDDDVDDWDDDEGNDDIAANPLPKTISTPISSTATPALKASVDMPPSAAPEAVKQPSPILSQNPPPPPPPPKATATQPTPQKTNNARKDLMGAIEQRKVLKKVEPTPTKPKAGDAPVTFNNERIDALRAAQEAKEVEEAKNLPPEAADDWDE